MRRPKHWRGCVGWVIRSGSKVLGESGSPLGAWADAAGKI